MKARIRKQKSACPICNERLMDLWQLMLHVLHQHPQYLRWEDHIAGDHARRGQYRCICDFTCASSSTLFHHLIKLGGQADVGGHFAKGVMLGKEIHEITDES